MRTVTRRTEFTEDHPDAYVVAASEVVGTFASGQSVHGTYALAADAPVGTFASGLADDVPATEPALGRRVERSS
jgi:hypothetical protein